MEREKSQKLKRQKKKAAFSQANFFSYLIILKNVTKIYFVTRVFYFPFFPSVSKYKYVNNAIVSTPTPPLNFPEAFPLLLTHFKSSLYHT